ncbi:MAG TPA: DnaJ domain-containing protein [Alphaproteobacteria bacterium]|nr:DnaJ domain-containing protein [Alphaproteobacteria bacterium]
MWTYLLLGIAILVIALFLGRWFASSPPATLARIIKWGGVTLAAAAALFLAVTGKAAQAIIPLALLVLPVILARLFSGPRMGPAGTGRPSTGQTSNVNTSYLRMTLDHDTGEMAGEVVAGSFTGRPLSDLTLDDLLRLFEECRRNDPPSAQLLEAYLDRKHGAEWRAKAGPAGAGAGETPSSAKMTVEEAREILGVGPDASPDDIKEAHRRLMLGLHPDHGGSTYLASKINQAKDLLLGA